MIQKRYRRNQVLYILKVAHDLGGNNFSPTKVNFYDEATGAWVINGRITGETEDRLVSYSQELLDALVQQFELEELVKLVDTATCPLKAYKTT